MSVTPENIEPGSEDFRPTDASQRLEPHLYMAYGLDRRGMQRLGMFVLAHVLVVTRLMRLALHAKLNEYRARDDHNLPFEKLNRELAKLMFGKHLGLARSTGLLPPEFDDIATKLNEARNALLHYKGEISGPFEVPTYKGQSVASDAGFRACMADVLKFIEEIPFSPLIAGDHRE